MDLSELKIGDSAKLIEVKGEGSERQHLLDMGLIPGTIVKLVKRAPMGDPLEIVLHGYNLAIRISHAKNLIVKKTNSDFYNLSCDANCSKCTKDCSKRSALAQDTLERLYSYSKQIKKDELINQTEHPGLGEPGRFHNKNSENPLPENKTITFALAGNQNSGKTTLFNAMTGSSQHVGNFPGVTIDRKDGNFEYKCTIGEDVNGEKIRKSFYSSKSLKEAKAKAEKYKIDFHTRIAAGDILPLGRISFERQALHVLEIKKRKIKINTWQLNWNNVINNHLIP